MEPRVIKNTNPIGSYLKSLPSFFAQPVRLFRSYRPTYLRADLIAGLTVAVILVPQAIAYAMIADLPPQMGLYSAIVAGVIGGLWGSSHHLQIGPTNTTSLLVLSTLLSISTPGSPEYLLMAGMIAVMVGLLQLFLGLARLGVLANFVSHSVIVGFSSGAGVLIAIKQLGPFLGISISNRNIFETIVDIVKRYSETNQPTLILGLGTIFLIVLLRRFLPRLPGPLLAMVATSFIVGFWQLDQQQVQVIGELPRKFPPFTRLPIFDISLIARLSSGALAVGAIGLVESISIARAISDQSGQRLDVDQQFVGQGLANLACGFLSGYPSAGSFTRSIVDYQSGSSTSLSNLFAGLFVFVTMMLLAPFARYIPRTALAAVLMITAYGMINRREILRIWRGAHEDAFIMIVTFGATLLLHLEFAVLTGILISLAVYVMKTSVPQVIPVIPNETFRHFTPQPDKAPCPQLGIVDIHGDLYFGAVNHIEGTIERYLKQTPEQRFLLLRMHSVDQCDFTGIHALESIVKTRRENYGDVFLVRTHPPVMELIRSTGLYEMIGQDHFLIEDGAISYLFHHVLDPAICIYECEQRVFYECQNLPKQTFPLDGLPVLTEPGESVASISARELWQKLQGEDPPRVIDVRAPREFARGHIPQAVLIPLPSIKDQIQHLSKNRLLIFVCRSGRRSSRTAQFLRSKGLKNLAFLKGGMLSWEAANLLEAIDSEGKP